MGQWPKKAHKNSRALNGDKPKKSRKTRIHIYIDEEVSTRLDELPFNKSKLINALLRWFLMGERMAVLQVKIVMGPGPGFEPGLGDLQKTLAADEAYSRVVDELMKVLEK